MKMPSKEEIKAAREMGYEQGEEARRRFLSWIKRDWFGVIVILCVLSVVVTLVVMALNYA